MSKIVTTIARKIMATRTMSFRPRNGVVVFNSGRGSPEELPEAAIEKVCEVLINFLGKKVELECLVAEKIEMLLKHLEREEEEEEKESVLRKGGEGSGVSTDTNQIVENNNKRK